MQGGLLLRVLVRMVYSDARVADNKGLAAHPNLWYQHGACMLVRVAVASAVIAVVAHSH
jgi:hypothetical protein